MSTSLLYHGLRSVLPVREHGLCRGRDLFGIEQPREGCVVRSVTRRRSAVAARRGGLRTLPIGSKRVS